MPHPVRADYSLGTGSPVIKRHQYAVNHLYVAEVSLTNETATIRLGTMALRNQMHDAEEIALAERMQLLRHVWAEKEQFPDNVAAEIAQHERHITVELTAGNAVEKTIARLEALVSENAQDLGIPYSEGTDVLVALLRLFILE